MATWDSYLSEHEKKVYAKAGLGSEIQIGKQAALIIVDVQYGFTGEDAFTPIEQSLESHPACCGPASWEAVTQIGMWAAHARAAVWPIAYTYMEGELPGLNDNVGVKGSMYDHPSLQRGERGTQIVAPIAPGPRDIVISKKKPSAFFGTPLVHQLIAAGVDTVDVTGCTTSGCIRATVIDAFSYGFNVLVPEDAVFDRGQSMHAMNLFDMKQKYAEVAKTADLIRQFEGGKQA